jgi:tRNA-dihydrouridine synthase B
LKKITFREDYNTHMLDSPAKGVSPTFHIRDIPIYGDAILAPMDGISDWPFRSICREYGSAMSCAEFVKAEFIVRAFERMAQRLAFKEEERPVVFQVHEDDPEQIVQAALRMEAKHPDIIDINLGCPARRVANRGSGVGLMRAPLKVAHIFRKLGRLLHTPVTAKIRLGWDDCRNYLLIARIVEQEGGAAIAVHGRTKEQGYSGLADWDAIAEVKVTVKIPVIGNGDVKTVADIDRMKAHTGCQAVMIGRAAIGNPWIFSRIERDQVTPEQVRQMIHRHLERHLEFYGERKGLVLFRKHAMQYLRLHALPRLQRTEILQQETAESFFARLDEAYRVLAG